MKYYKYKSINGIDIKFRTISAEEADRFYNAVRSENPFAEEFIFNTITNDKYDTDDLEAGIIPIIVYCSFELSGYYTKLNDIPDAIDKARTDYGKDIYHKMFYSKIMKIMPGSYKLEELKEKSVKELLELYVLSENIIEANIHDTNKMRAALLEEDSTAKKPKNKAINLITKEELESLKATLNANEIDGAPIDSI